MNTTTPSTRLGLAVLRVPDDREALREHIDITRRILKRVWASVGYDISAEDGTDLLEAVRRLDALAAGLAVETEEIR